MSKEKCVLYTHSYDINPCVIISINSKGDSKYEGAAPYLKNHENVKDVLFLYFDDVEPYELFEYDDLFLFTSNQARSILDFIEKWMFDVEEIIIHCHSGISRSSAVASGICLFLGIDNSWTFENPYCPNEYVLKILFDAIKDYK